MIYYFGGKFNPWTRGHFNVIDSLCKNIEENNSWGENDEIVIGVTELDDSSGITGHELCSNEEYRMDLIRPSINYLINKYKFLNDHPGLYIDFQDKKYTYEFLEKFCNEHKINDWKNNVVLVLGEDEYQDLVDSACCKYTIPKWKYATELLKLKSFVAKRESIGNTISGTKIRNIFYRNPYTNYDDVKDYITRDVFDRIKQQHHYWQYGYEDTYRIKENNSLKNYDITKFPRPSATVDMMVIKEYIHENNTVIETDPYKDEILLIRRKNFPYKGFWALPGGFLDIDSDESLEEAASRELMEETSIYHKFTRNDQFRTYSDMGTDPRGRIVDTVFVVKTTKDIFCPCASDDALEFGWFKISELPRMAFNHRQIIDDYLTRNDKMNDGQ